VLGLEAAAELRFPGSKPYVTVAPKSFQPADNYTEGTK
jgi:hypothetical protein